jgi:hypothetical protein
MRIFKNKAFNRWSLDIKLDDKQLKRCVDEIVQGQYEANLGSCVYKKRIALNGWGKRGGARTIVVYKCEHRAVYIYGYAKNNRANVNEKEVAALKKLAKVYLDFTESQIVQAIKLGELIEVEVL